MNRTKEKDFHVKRAHDRQAVEVCGPEEIVFLDADECDKLIDRLRTERRKLQSESPPAPEPLDFADEFAGDEIAREYACSTPCEPPKVCAINIGGYELSVDMAIRLHCWLDKTIRYHKKCRFEGKP